MRRLSLAAALVAAGLMSVAPARAADPWEATIDRVSRAVVAIRVSAVRAFDTEGPSTSVATGFVVDAERGLILTNRHVVQPGPVKAHAIFLNHEEVEVVPVYRDPVHDFGIYRYDPKALQFMKPEALELAPQAARVGSSCVLLGTTQARSSRSWPARSRASIAMRRSTAAADITTSTRSTTRPPRGPRAAPRVRPWSIARAA